jgi:hypothetical protein
LKPSCHAQLTEVSGRDLHPRSKAQDALTYPVRMIKPNLIDSHDWHVQPYCQRSLQLFA